MCIRVVTTISCMEQNRVQALSETETKKARPADRFRTLYNRFVWQLVKICSRYFSVGLWDRNVIL